MFLICSGLCRNIGFFIVTCLLCIFAQLTNINVLGMLAIRNLNNWVISQEFLLVDLAKTQYTRDDEGPISLHKP